MERLKQFSKFILLSWKYSVVSATLTVGCCVNVQYSYIDPEVRFSSSRFGLVYTANTPV